MSSILIKNGVVINASGRARQDVLIEGDKIAAVGQSLTAPGAEMLDAEGCFVLPGFIDTHTHFGLEVGGAITADNFASGSKAAALGGTTCVLDFATQAPGGSLQQALQNWHAQAQGASCNYGFHMAIAHWDEDVRQELPTMVEQGVTSFKMYMVYDGLKVDDGQIYSALQETAKLDTLVGVHCENWEVLLRRIREVQLSGITGPEGHPLSRPNAVEAEAVARLMRIAELAQAPCYVVHLSTAEGLEEALRARARGQKVFLETCPQYLLLTDARYGDADGAKFVMSPPLRKAVDTEALWQALQSGQINTIGTDHCSFTMAQKNKFVQDFSKIPNGAAGVQHRGQLLYTYGVCEGRITLEQMVALLSANAAKLFGMPDYGEIAPGKAADVVIWDPAYEGCITDTNTAHNCDNSPYAGFIVKGRAKDVLLHGELAVQGGSFKQAGLGKYIHRSRCDFD
ncbi:MAG: dihydropyrimidinase [Christensenellaceae bacterium]|nr:dihydropyrimidinase [Christensenellaceae bacterium]